MEKPHTDEYPPSSSQERSSKRFLASPIHFPNPLKTSIPFLIAVFVTCHVAGVTLFLFIEAGPDELSELLCEIPESEVIFNESKYSRCFFLVNAFLPSVLFYLICFTFWIAKLIWKWKEKTAFSKNIQLARFQKVIRIGVLSFLCIAAVCTDFSVPERWVRNGQIKSWFLGIEWIGRNCAFLCAIIELSLHFKFKDRPTTYLRVFLTEYAISVFFMSPNVLWYVRHSKHWWAEISHYIFLGSVFVVVVFMLLGSIWSIIEVPYTLEQRVENALRLKVKGEFDIRLSEKYELLLEEVEAKYEFFQGCLEHVSKTSDSNTPINEEKLQEYETESARWKQYFDRLDAITSEARVQVIEDFDGINFHVKAGDIFTRISDRGDFWYGISNGKRGLVPKRCVKSINQMTFPTVRMRKYFLTTKTFLVGLFGLLGGISYSVGVYFISQRVSGNDYIEVASKIIGMKWLIMIALALVAVFSAIERKMRMKSIKNIKDTLSFDISRKTMNLDSQTIQRIGAINVQDLVLHYPKKFAGAVRHLGEICLPFGSAAFCIVSLFLLDLRLSVMTTSITIAVSLFICWKIFVVKPYLKMKKQPKTDALRAELKEIVDERENIRFLLIDKSKEDALRLCQEEEGAVSQRNSSIQAVLTGVEWILLGFITVAILFFSDFLQEHHLLSQEEKSAYNLLSVNLIYDIYVVIMSLKSFFEKYGCATYIASYLALPIDLSLNGFGTEETEDIELQHYDVEFENVSLIIGKKEIIKDFTCQFKEGRQFGIVGQSGCGKSTIFALLLRVFKPTSGVIKIGGRNIADFPIRQLYKIVRIIPQRASVFRGSARRNIELGTQGLRSSEGVDQVLEGIDKHQDCSTLSGGQQQRVCTLRGLLSGARVILLDEATSALDIESESKVVELLHVIQRKEKCTIINVAHRLHIVRNADGIFVLRAAKFGKSLMELGVHEELIAQRGWYSSQLNLLQNNESNTNNTNREQPHCANPK